MNIESAAAHLTELTKLTELTELTELTIRQIVDLFAAGTLTAEKLTHAHLARVAALNPKYNAIIFLHHPALDDARAIDVRRANGEALGPLAGIPIVVKDTMDMAGYPTTGGWALLSSKVGGVDLMPAIDSPVVRRMREAGCIILGKTNVPILSATGTHANNSWAGPTLNAAAVTRMPGGSSAGTATAVATQMAVVGLAEETGGSIQNPAAAQALVGIKPTFALVPNVGVMPLAGSTRDVVGPIARTVHDAALVLDVLAGYDAEDPKTVASVGKRPSGGYTSLLKRDALRGKRLGLYGPGWRNRRLSDETAAHYGRAQAEMVDRGAVMISDPFAGSGFEALAQVASGTEYYDARGMECIPYDMEQYLRRMGPNAAISSWQAFSAVARLDDPFAPGGVLPFMPSMAGFAEALARPDTNSTVAAFFALRERYLAVFNRVMDAHALDGLIFPQLRAELPFRESNETLRETAVCEINIAGLPGVTVPGGYYHSGSPFGLIFIGRQWDEAALLGMAYDYEQATCHRRTFVQG